MAEFADRLFDGTLPWSRIRQDHKLICLGQRYPPQRPDAACRKALAVEVIDRAAWAACGASWCGPWSTRRLPSSLPPLGRFARPDSVFARAKGQRQQPFESTEYTELKTGGQS